MNDFEQKLGVGGKEGLRARDITTVQVNLGRLCNQECAHCHMEASPTSDEMMTWQTMESILEATREIKGILFDLTGGAPELNPHFKRFVQALVQRGHQVQVRTNLTVLMEPDLAWVPDFLKENEVQLVASMPCYLEENVTAQRGEGVYHKSIAAIGRLNELGYGIEPRLRLDLVYNPGGPDLPASQSQLEADYRRELNEHYNIRFTNLLTITNLPLGRFNDQLEQAGQAQEYMELLTGAYNPATLDGLMCRHQISVAWDGSLHDCDFNLALGLPIDGDLAGHIDELETSRLTQRRIVTGSHCFGCTAGAGSSCGGALVSDTG